MFLEFRIHKDADPRDAIEAICNLEEIHSSVAGINCVIGIRPTIWRTLAPNDIPQDMFDFTSPLTADDGFVIPATQRDIWIWFSSQSIGQVFDAAVLTINRLEGLAELEADIYGWNYRFNRDLTGFIDGSANPNFMEAAKVAIIPDSTPGQGGSVLLFQKWQHDMRSFSQLDIKKQEQIIGRTKVDSTEFAEDLLPKNSHVARTTIEKNNQEQPIFRRNVSHGTPSNHGTLFIGFTNNQKIVHEMLQRMAGVLDGPRDALTFYSIPATGSYYFIPSSDSLMSFATEIEFLTTTGSPTS